MAEKNWTNLIKSYGGQWVALADDEVTVLASNKDIHKVVESSAKKGQRKPILFKVPSEVLPYVSSV